MVKGVSIMRKLAFSGLTICQGKKFLFKLRQFNFEYLVKTSAFPTRRITPI